MQQTQGGVWPLNPDRCFDPDPAQRGLARTLHEGVRNLPLVCPHGHVPPELLADPNATLGNPAELLIVPDHYVFRMLYSRGVPLESLGVARRDGGPVETDGRRIWQTFAEHFHLFRGTPTGLWLHAELVELFGVAEKLTGASAGRIYDQLVEKLAQPEFRPRALFAQFNIETLCTTDAATDTLEHHRALRDAGYTNVRPTFRPDGVVNLDAPGWRANIDRLSEVSGEDVTDYRTFIRAFESRRAAFKELGATATDYSTISPYTARMRDDDAAALFDRALRDEAMGSDAARFAAHMIVEMARMSAEDGLVMQLHMGSYRNHNTALFDAFGADKGADIPVQTDWTLNLHGLLNERGSDPRFRCILFTLDETTFSRELAPLAGHYPALLLGPPWWFYDSVAGITRYLDAVIETAGFANTTGFNDDTRAFASIPTRHDVWRRTTCNWLAGQVVRGLMDEEDAAAAAHDCAYGLAKRAYNL